MKAKRQVNIKKSWEAHLSSISFIYLTPYFRYFIPPPFPIFPTPHPILPHLTLLLPFNFIPYSPTPTLSLFLSITHSITPTLSLHHFPHFIYSHIIILPSFIYPAATFNFTYYPLLSSLYLSLHKTHHTLYTPTSLISFYHSTYQLSLLGISDTFLYVINLHTDYLFNLTTLSILP